MGATAHVEPEEVGGAEGILSRDAAEPVDLVCADACMGVCVYVCVYVCIGSGARRGGASRPC